MIIESVAKIDFITKPVKRRSRRRLVILFVCTIFGLILFWTPITNYWTIATADPDIVQLAKQANMSVQGEVKFLQMSPELVTDSQMMTVCASNTAANNANGFIEQGCYVPNSTDPTTGKIYIRKMPSDFQTMEATTAAYELLHPIYISLIQSGSSTLDSVIESNFKTNEDTNLDTQVANFAKTESNYRDLELFSILGTEYPNISSDLKAYYSPYFNDDLFTVVNLNQHAFDKFTAIENNLTQLEATIKSYDDQANQAYSLADTAYYNSTTWAAVGNSYENNRNYNIYIQYFNNYKQELVAENIAIDQYNQLLNRTNVLITEYEGTQPVNTTQNVQGKTINP